MAFTCSDKVYFWLGRFFNYIQKLLHGCAAKPGSASQNDCETPTVIISLPRDPRTINSSFRETKSMNYAVLRDITDEIAITDSERSEICHVPQGMPDRSASAPAEDKVTEKRRHYSSSSPCSSDSSYLRVTPSKHPRISPIRTRAQSLNKPRTNHLGLHNPLLQCFMNASLQALAAAEPFRRYLTNADVWAYESFDVRAVAHVLNEIQASKPFAKKSVSRQLKFLAAMNEALFSMPNTQQQDAHEYITLLLQMLSENLHLHRGLNLYEDIFKSTSVMLPCFCEGECKLNITPESRELQQVILTLAIPERSRRHWTVQELVDRSLSTEFVDRCCNTTVSATSIFTKLPEVLIVSLRRYTAKGNKIHSSIKASPDLVLAEFRLNEGDLDSFKSNEDSRKKSSLLEYTNKCYELVGIVNHLGNMVKSGHYIAGVYNSNERVWVKVNDMIVELSDLPKLIQESANTCYLLVYVAIHKDEDFDLLSVTATDSASLSD